MPRAGHEKLQSARTTPQTPPADTLSAVAIAASLLDEQLLPATNPVDAVRIDESEAHGDHEHALGIAIQQRIESRLPGRVRNLRVRIFDGLVILEGECATYYTKQLAQHAAMGILEEEHLENAIVVNVSQ